MRTVVNRKPRVGVPSSTLPNVYEVPLTKGKIAFIDAVDFPRVSEWSWCAYEPHDSIWYSRANTANSDGGRWYVSMHQFIMQQPPGYEVDHVNSDGLDNRRCNLRVCIHKENMRNMVRRCLGSSRYKGVSWYARYGCWRAYIVVDAKQSHLGYFSDELQAAQAYDRAAKELFGDFARPNFPDAVGVASRVETYEMVQQDLFPVG